MPLWALINMAKLKKFPILKEYVKFFNPTFLFLFCKNLPSTLKFPKDFFKNPADIFSILSQQLNKHYCQDALHCHFFVYRTSVKNVVRQQVQTLKTISHVNVDWLCLKSPTFFLVHYFTLL